MKIIRNNFIPFRGYKAMNICGILFVRGDANIDDVTLNHESIHTAQWKELWYIGFLLWYGIEWLVRLTQFRYPHNAYRNISFEREAYDNEKDLEYLKTRERFSFLKYL